MKNRILLVIPTLNEFGNIQKIYKKIKKLKNKIDLLFVDDNSTDGSKEVIINLRKKNKKVNYIFRKKKLGVGSAHKVGIKLAKKKNYRYVCTIDCDGTHNPKDINKMLKKIQNSHMVITNRFIKKKSMAGWAFRRILQTKLRYYLVRFLLGSKLDGSGGFRLYDLKIIKLKDIFEAEDNYYNFFLDKCFYIRIQKI